VDQCRSLGDQSADLSGQGIAFDAQGVALVDRVAERLTDFIVAPDERRMGLEQTIAQLAVPGGHPLTVRGKQLEPPGVGRRLEPKRLKFVEGVVARLGPE
jgi:hypothetical protein